MARRNLRKTRAILFAAIGLVVYGAAFAAIPLMAPGSTDPEGLSRILGRIGGGAGVVGLLFLVQSLFVQNDPKT